MRVRGGGGRRGEGGRMNGRGRGERRERGKREDEGGRRGERIPPGRSGWSLESQLQMVPILSEQQRTEGQMKRGTELCSK